MRLAVRIQVTMVPSGYELARIAERFVPCLLAGIQRATGVVLLKTNAENGIAPIGVGIHDAVLVGADDVSSNH